MSAHRRSPDSDAWISACTFKRWHSLPSSGPCRDHTRRCGSPRAFRGTRAVARRAQRSFSVLARRIDADELDVLRSARELMRVLNHEHSHRADPLLALAVRRVDSEVTNLARSPNLMSFNAKVS